MRLAVGDGAIRFHRAAARYEGLWLAKAAVHVVYGCPVLVDGFGADSACCHWSWIFWHCSGCVGSHQVVVLGRRDESSSLVAILMDLLISAGYRDFEKH